jgi:hypothetical protein
MACLRASNKLLISAAVLACLAVECSARWPRAPHGRRHWSPYVPSDMFVPLGGIGADGGTPMVAGELAGVLQFAPRNGSRARGRGGLGAAAKAADTVRPTHTRGAGLHDDMPAGGDQLGGLDTVVFQLWTLAAAEATRGRSKVLQQEAAALVCPTVPDTMPHWRARAPCARRQHLQAASGAATEWHSQIQ